MSLSPHKTEDLLFILNPPIWNVGWEKWSIRILHVKGTLNIYIGKSPLGSPRGIKVTLGPTIWHINALYLHLPTVKSVLAFIVISFYLHSWESWWGDVHSKLHYQQPTLLCRHGPDWLSQVQYHRYTHAASGELPPALKQFHSPSSAEDGL